MAKKYRIVKITTKRNIDIYVIQRRFLWIWFDVLEPVPDGYSGALYPSLAQAEQGLANILRKETREVVKEYSF